MRYLILSLILLSGCTKHTIKHEVSAPQLDNLEKKLEPMLTKCPEAECQECPKFAMAPVPQKATLIINGTSLKGTDEGGKLILKHYVHARELLK